MPLQLLLALAMIVIAGALWFRRESFKCAWEGAPTLLTASAGLWVYLTSPHASEYLGPAIYSVTGIYHFETYLGNLAALTCASAGVYMFLVRINDGEELHLVTARWITMPLALLVPVLFVCHVLAVAAGPHSERLTAQYLQQAHYPGFWMLAYWSVMTGALIYLMACCLRVLTYIREGVPNRSRHYSRVINVYFAAIWWTLGALAIIAIDILAPVNLSVWAMGSAYVAVMLWAAATAYAWRVKSRPLIIESPDQWPLTEGGLRPEEPSS